MSRRGRALSPFRSVGARLSLALVAVVALALGVVYGIVVPSLERELRENRLDQLARSGRVLAGQFPPFGFDPTFALGLSDFIEDSAETASARVVLYELFDPQTRALRVVEDSRGGQSSGDVASDPLALRAALTGRAARGIIEREGSRFAEVAVPVHPARNPTVLVFSAPLDETLESADLVRKRLLLAGALGLGIAAAIGYALASVFARRLRRLERAADRIAAGKLDEPVVDRGSDEVTELAEAFERMRGKLAQLEHARREFIANASHELRTPIFSLGGFLELLASEDLDEATRREFLASMHEQVERLTKLATDLLDLSRLDAGRLHVERERLELGHVADALAVEFAAIARATDHSLAVERDGAAETLADEQRVLQIGRILVENALRHTPGGTSVRIRAGGEDGRAVLAVEDDGPGIAPEHAEHVFERFYRVEGERASGSGLGLAIARELAEAMGGSVVMTAPGVGSAFTVELPAAPETDQGT
jgi:two-component system OmpR family sensor kinase